MLEAFFAACVPFYNRRRGEPTPVEVERRKITRNSANQHLYDSIERLTVAVEKKKNDIA